MNTFAVGEVHSIRLGDDGNGYVWGHNYNGQLGLEHNYDLNTPMILKSPNNYKWISFVCESYSSFGMTENREVFSWGFNYYGQLGLGHFKDQNKPQLLLCSNDSEWKELFCGGNHTIGISVHGKTFVWGKGEEEQHTKGPAYLSFAHFKPPTGKL